MKFPVTAMKQVTFPFAFMMDMVFLLLIFFILTWDIGTIKVKHGITLPATKNAATIKHNHLTITITLNQQGAIFIAKKTYNLKQLAEKLTELHTLHNDYKINIYADTKSPLGKGLQIIETCHHIGFKQVAFYTKNKSTIP